jgi:hypothetical protein
MAHDNERFATIVFQQDYLCVGVTAIAGAGVTAFFAFLAGLAAAATGAGVTATGAGVATIFASADAPAAKAEAANRPAIRTANNFFILVSFGAVRGLRSSVIRIHLNPCQ